MPLITSVFSSPLQSSAQVYHHTRHDSQVTNLKRRVAFSSVHYGGSRGDCSTMTASTVSNSLRTVSTNSALHSVSENEEDCDSLSSVSTWTRPGSLGWGWGSVESRKSYQCLTTLYADHCSARDKEEECLNKSSNEEKILCFRAKRMMICKDDTEAEVDIVTSRDEAIKFAAWGYFVDTVE